ncbi:3067_t:CDS:2, partial [Racocetra fulgida]
NFKKPLQPRDYDFQDLKFSILITTNEIDPHIESDNLTKNLGSFCATISIIENVTDTDNHPEANPILKSYLNITLSRNYDNIHSNFRILSLR